MSEKGLFKPSSKGIRDPLTNQQENGRIVNSLRFAQIGGFTSAKKGISRNNFAIKKPSDTR